MGLDYVRQLLHAVQWCSLIDAAPVGGEETIVFELIFRKAMILGEARRLASLLTVGCVAHASNFTCKRQGGDGRKGGGEKARGRGLVSNFGACPAH